MKSLMKSLFDFADKFNRQRSELKVPVYWIPKFVITILDFLKLLLKFYLYVSFVFLPFCFSYSVVSSGSMTPTCQTNEILLASQLSSGIKLSKFLPFQINTKNESFLDKVFWQYESPKLGDIIALKVPSDQESVYTKRIVGDEGDVVQFKNGVLFIN